MKKFKAGFTIIEVSIFLAISGVLLVGIIAGTSNSIAQQRYNDSVQNFAEFLRNIYSKVTNVQNNGGGRSEEAIYGKLVTFGETTDFEGNTNSGTVFSYDVIGNASREGLSSNEGVLNALSNRGIKVTKSITGEGDITEYSYAGISESYNLNWGSTLEKPEKNDEEESEAFVGSLLVVRSPDSGTIHTYFYDKAIEVNESIYKRIALDLSPQEYFTNTQDVNFCIQSDSGFVYGGQRSNVRIHAGSHNSSGVEIMPLDDPIQNVCK